MNDTNGTLVLQQLCSPVIVENSIYAKAVKMFAYCLVLLMSSSGNILLCLIVFRHRKTGMLTTTNCFIVNMAMSDLIIPLFAVPNKLFNLEMDSNFRWFLGGNEGLMLCKCLNFFLDVSTAVSIQSLVAIAVDRFYGVLYPLRAVRHRNSKACTLVIPIIWFNAIAFHGVYFYTFRLIDFQGKHYCLINWRPYFDSKAAQKPFYLVQFTFLYVCPLILIAFLYGCIVTKLRSSTISSGKCRRRRASEQYRNRKVTKMCLVAVLVFAFCWAPIHVYGFLFHFVWDWIVPCGMQEIDFVVFFVAYSYAAINPCIFFTFNENFRRGLVRVLCCRSVKKRMRRPSWSSWRSRSTSGVGVRMIDANCNSKEDKV